MERETRRLEGLGQLGFAFVAEMSEQQGRTDETDQNDLFLDPVPCGLYVGSQKLDVYAKEIGLGECPLRCWN
jgi:hypothetical protein